MLSENLREVREEASLAGISWAFGPQCWVLEGVEPLAEPVAAVGRQGLWDWTGS